MGAGEPGCGRHRCSTGNGTALTGGLRQSGEAQVPQEEIWASGTALLVLAQVPHRQQCPSASKSGTPGCGDTLLVQVLLHNYSTVSMLSCIRHHCSGRLTSQQFGRVAGYIVGCPSPGEDVQLGLLRRRARPTVGKIRKGASQPPFKLKLLELFIKIGPHRSLHHRNIPATRRVAIFPFYFCGL